MTVPFDVADLQELPLPFQAYPDTPPQEQEDSMPRSKVSAREAAIAVLEREGHPLHVSEIAERVLASYDTGLKGRTPEASIAAMLHTLANKGETFRKTKPGTFTLRAHHASSQAKPHPKPSGGAKKVRRQNRAKARAGATA